MTQFLVFNFSDHPKTPLDRGGYRKSQEISKISWVKYIVKTDRKSHTVLNIPVTYFRAKN